MSVRWLSSVGGSGPCTGTASWACALTLVSGPQTITVRAFDAAGNAGDDDLEVTYLPTDPPPVVTISSPTTSSSYLTSSRPLVLDGTASDAGGIVAVRWSSSNGGSGACTGTTSWSCVADLSTSQQTITIEATDSENNLGEDTLVVSYAPIDEQPTEVSLTSLIHDDVILMQRPVTGTVVDANLLKYDLECADNGDGVFFRVGGGTAQPANDVLGVIDATTMRNGLYTCRVCATDINNRRTCEERTTRSTAERRLAYSLCPSMT
ncbi:MAG: hypothetical protein HYV07_17070 [Deltaproteobacteria bacterium]|nr:hypothetical protein [Deltaproteobacteria bacterium]